MEKRTLRLIGCIAFVVTLAACAVVPARQSAPALVVVAPTPTPEAQVSVPAIQPPPAPVTPVPPTSETQTLIDFLQEQVAADPSVAEAQRELGLAILQRIRETADPSAYPVAEQALEVARRLAPDDPLALVGLGALRLGQHRFAEALEHGRAALELEPGYPPARAVAVDALIELGRYDEAFAEAEDLASSSPGMASLARLSYTRELQGDLPGALDAMQQAAAAPGLAPENTAYVTSLVGHLQLLGGDPTAARASFERGLGLVSDHPPSLAGLGRAALTTGDLAEAMARFERAAAVVPLPEYVIALAETLDVAGEAGEASRTYDLARAEIALFESSGVVVDLELALFEADHGVPSLALELAQAAYDATPTIRAADALSWALYRNGRFDEAAERSTEALRLGSIEPLVRYHAGAIAAASGRLEEARTHLEQALGGDAGFSATGAADARRLLDSLPD